MKELKSEELRDVNGGVLGIDDVVFAVIVGATLAILNDWDNVERGFKGEPWKE